MAIDIIGCALSRCIQASSVWGPINGSEGVGMAYDPICDPAWGLRGLDRSICGSLLYAVAMGLRCRDLRCSFPIRRLSRQRPPRRNIDRRPQPDEFGTGAVGGVVDRPPERLFRPGHLGRGNLGRLPANADAVIRAVGDRERLPGGPQTARGE